jgi:Zn-dependent M16 (insulinase) family peptidase
MNMWNYDQDPRRGYLFEDALNSLKDDIGARGSVVFTEMIQEQIIGNLHRIAVELYPSDTLQETQAQV